jgi:exodeoxyribonuclease VII large subunit
MADSAVPTYVTVSDLNRQVKETIGANRDLRSLWVVGELSNVRKNSSAHLFPRLKDDKAELSLVIWESIAEKFGPLIKDGAKVLVHGSIRVYEAKGAYQLYVDDIREFGVGELYAQLERLKKKLKEEGLFEQKRPLPHFPHVIGVVTSLSGAVIQDILRNLSSRFPPIRVIVTPVQVQGSGAGPDIAAGIAAMNKLVDPKPDLLIVGRGGGSLEDLWAFNEEVVARALFASKIPTISAVGHQTDFTIADLVADHRAATPTEAAIDAVPDSEELLSELDESQRSLVAEMVEVLEALNERTGHAADLLNSLDPQRILQRGYSVVAKAGRVVSSVAGLHRGDDLAITMRDGSVQASVDSVTPSGMG